MIDSTTANAERSRDAMRSVMSSPDFAELNHHWYNPILRFIKDPIGEMMNAIGWAFDQISHPFEKPGGAIGLAVVLVLVAAFGLWRLTRSMSRDAGRSVGLEVALPKRTAEELDCDADIALRNGDYQKSIRNRFSALLVRLDVREIVQLRAGKTTGEYAHSVSLNAPRALAEFNSAVRIFEQVWYGGTIATEADAKQLQEHCLAVLRVATSVEPQSETAVETSQLEPLP